MGQGSKRKKGSPDVYVSIEKMMDDAEEKYSVIIDAHYILLKNWFVGELGKLGEGINDINIPEEITRDYVDNFMDEYRKSGTISANFTIDQIKKAKLDHGIEMRNSELDWNMIFTEKMDAQYDRVFESAGITDAKILSDAKSLVMDGFKSGMSVDEQIRNLDKVFPGFPDWRKEVIIRTNATDSVNAGRMSVMKTDENVIGMTFWAVLDERTTEECTRLNGQNFRKDDPQLDSITPPIHYDCRSYMEPIFTWDEGIGFKDGRDYLDQISPEFQVPKNE